MKSRLLLLATALTLQTFALRAADVIPASRLGNWTPGTNTGVPGGIPTTRTHLVDVTKAPYGADSSGASDVNAALTAAIRAAADGDVIYLPAGTYRLNTPVQIFGKSNFTIRGDGESTIIQSYCGYPAAFYFGVSDDYLWNYPSGGIPIASGFGKSSTSITVADASSLSVGQLIQIKEDDDRTMPVMNLGATTGSHGSTQKTRIIAKNGNTLTISPGLYWGLNSTLNPRIYASRGSAKGIGFEKFKIDSSNATSAYVIWLEQCTDSWIKDVRLSSSYQYGVFMHDCLNMEIRRTNFDASGHTGTNGAGLLVEGTCASLIEDNIFYKFFPHIEVNFGSCGNAFTYNFFEDSSVYGGLGVSIDSNHGPHNRQNLYEGNVTPLFQCDGYFGSSSDDIVFRNWIQGASAGTTSVRQPIILNRFTRNYTVVGNLLGKPGVPHSSFYSFGMPLMGNETYSGTAQPSVGSYWSDWNSYISNTYTKGTNDGFMEMDLDVQASSIVKANYNTTASAVPAEETISTTLAPSLYRTAKPDWFGNLTWPAFDSARPNMTFDAIPAGYRWVHGTDPLPDSGTTTTAPTPTPTPPIISPQPPINVRVITR